MPPNNRPSKGQRQILEARERGELCDLTIVCGDGEIPVHKIIVLPQCPIINTACTGPYKEQETGVYEIKDSAFPIVRQMVEYLYTGNYTAPYYNQKDKENDAISPPLFHAMMAELADKYLMSELQLLSVEKFKKIARHPWDCPILLPSIADIYSLQGESNKTLREILIESVREQITASQHFEFYLALNQATDEVPAFTKDLLFSFISQPVLSSCNNCGRGKAVPIKPLQCKCADCGEGAARHLRIGW